MHAANKGIIISFIYRLFIIVYNKIQISQVAFVKQVKRGEKKHTI